MLRPDLSLYVRSRRGAVLCSDTPTGTASGSVKTSAGVSDCQNLSGSPFVVSVCGFSADVSMLCVLDFIECRAT